MQRKQRSETQMKITLYSIILYTETKIFVVNKSCLNCPLDYTTEKNFETVLTNRWQKMTKLENIGVLSTNKFGLHQVNLQMDS